MPNPYLAAALREQQEKRKSHKKTATKPKKPASEQVESEQQNGPDVSGN